MRRVVIFVFSLVMGFALPLSKADENDSPIGKKIEEFRLQDAQGQWHALSDWDQHQLLVVAFVGTECPLARWYGPRLAEISDKLQERNVGVIAIDANQQDTLSEIADYVKQSQIQFPVLKDPGNKVADAFGAQRTPEVFLLDRERTVRFYGRIDDQTGIGYTQPTAHNSFLLNAVEDLLAGREVAQSYVEPVGCYIGRVTMREPTGDITYSGDIAAIMNQHCVRCHRPGEIAPFPLTSYEDVAAWAETIREVVSEQRMPPWHANPEHGSFSNDRRMSDEDKQKLFAWIDNGAPEGDPAAVPPLPEFTDGWQIPKPDLVLEMPEPIQIPATGVMDYQYVDLKQQFDEDKWIIAGEARPGNRRVVHHLILFYVPPGYDRSFAEAALFNSLAGFAPGLPAWHSRAGVAKRVPAGSRLFLQLHYTPNGSPQQDISRAGVVFAPPEQVRKILRTGAVLNYQFAIPAGAENFELEASHRFQQDTFVVSLLPHMHLRGKAFRFEAVYANGDRKVLLDVPRYDFNWQNIYILKTPVFMPEGSSLHCTAVYDNSEKNRSNPDPKRVVTWGDQTWDEMMVGQYEAVLASEDLTMGRPKVKPLDDGRFEVTFSFRPSEPVKAVYLAGSFNDWKADGHAMEGPDAEGRYHATITLDAGKYEYKFVLDGEKWRYDPGNPDQVGFYNNSLLTLAKPAK